MFISLKTTTGAWPPVPRKKEEKTSFLPRSLPPLKEEKEEDVSEADMVRELFEPMRAWYVDRARDELRSSHGAFPPTAEALRDWTSFKAVTSAFLDEPVAAPPTKRRSRFGDATGKKKKKKRDVAAKSARQLVLVRLFL